MGQPFSANGKNGTTLVSKLKKNGTTIVSKRKKLGQANERKTQDANYELESPRPRKYKVFQFLANV